MDHQPRDTSGRFDEKHHSAPEVALDDRARNLAAAEVLQDELNAKNRHGNLPREEVKAMRAKIAALQARPDRQHPPLNKLSMQPYNRSVYAFVTHHGEEDSYDLNPPYQRETVWTVEQRQALIESLMRGIPVGSVILNHRGYSSSKVYAVVDGKQRIEALRAFHADEFNVPADWFEDEDIARVKPDGTVSFSDLTVRGQRGFFQLPIPSMEAHAPSVTEEARIFGLVNSSGTEQTAEDLARASAVAGE